MSICLQYSAYLCNILSRKHLILSLVSSVHNTYIYKHVLTADDLLVFSIVLRWCFVSLRTKNVHIKFNITKYYANIPVFWSVLVVNTLRNDLSKPFFSFLCLHYSGNAIRSLLWQQQRQQCCLRWVNMCLLCL